MSLNTKISYLYRDASNYKVYNECVVKGTMTPEQIQTILDCCDDEYFIPSKVGLPEKRFDTMTDDDHIWFEMNEAEGCFSETAEPANVDITCAELVEAFCRCAGKWEDDLEYIDTSNKMSVVLYNAISVLMDETWDQYEDKDEWFAMLQNELGVSADELEELGYKITVDGGLYVVEAEKSIDDVLSQASERSAATNIDKEAKIKATTIYFTTNEGPDATQFDTQDTAELLELFVQLLKENNLELVSVDGIEKCEFMDELSEVAFNGMDYVKE